VSLVPLSLILILAGLGMCWLCGSVRSPVLATVVYWSGVVLIVIGLVLLLFPVMAWLHRQLSAMLGAG
jgi:hypothetical protein